MEDLRNMVDVHFVEMMIRWAQKIRPPQDVLHQDVPLQRLAQVMMRGRDISPQLLLFEWRLALVELGDVKRMGPPDVPGTVLWKQTMEHLWNCWFSTTLSDSSFTNTQNAQRFHELILDLCYALYHVRIQYKKIGTRLGTTSGATTALETLHKLQAVIQ